MKIKTILLIVFLFSLGLINAQDKKKSNAIDDCFKDWSTIRTSDKQTERIDETTLAWGKDVLAAMNLKNFETKEKARAIQMYVSRDFKFHFSRPRNIPEFLKTRKGNCYAHSRLSVFLLRLAGIPAKFAYEVHLEHKSANSAKQARKAGTGLFGHFHNDHFWILYFDCTRWTPYDSALGYTGFDGFVSRWDGTETIPDIPPFIIWEDTGAGSSDMSNITEYIWNQFPVKKHNDLKPEEWKKFIANFYDKDVSFFKTPLDQATENLINTVARKFFKSYQD